MNPPLIKKGCIHRAYKVLIILNEDDYAQKYLY